MITDAYTNCRFIGRNRPFIDPVKEVQALRLQLGSDYDNIPLTTIQQAVEKLGNGDFETIMETIEKETDNITTNDNQQ